MRGLIIGYEGGETIALVSFFFYCWRKQEYSGIPTHLAQVTVKLLI
jgi:hypothetical protein